ncbi:DUF6600 domain-containing protein [Pandoraea sp.]|uniref:DUF6600 domain-containing protein n=1 Tax=Pandoraea sp. TaxID=1883445 RepID=UPI0035B005EE
MKSLISWWSMARNLGIGLALGAVGAAGVPALAYAQSADPPGRVARLNDFDGTVTYAPAGTSEWHYADRNRPLTTGDAVWVDRNSRAEMHVGGTAVRMGASTSVVLSAVTDQNVQLNVTQGTVGLRLRAYDPNRPYEIDTPNLAFVPQQPGEYRVDIDPNGVTTVSVWRGAATVYGQGASVPLQQGQRVAFIGQNLMQQPTGQRVADAFDEWVRQRDAREDASVSARYVPREMTGFESLDDYGVWQETSTYGAVWVPSDVPSGWAPYRTGHWVWVEPWGWTWVDDAPWGFAPYHYGRWAYVDARWCWVPGPVAARPVYAPALVGWVSGNSGGNQWGISFAAGGMGLAWFALGPHDAYRPAYRASSSYVTNINRSTVIRTTDVTQIYVNNVYVNRNVRGAVSTMPAHAFVQGRPVGAPVALAAPRAGQPWRVGNTPGVAPVQQSVFGNSRRAAGAPPAGLFNRQVLATRSPVARMLPSRELTSQLHAVPDAGGTPLALGRSAQQMPKTQPGVAGSPGRIQPRVTVVGTHGPVGAPIGANGANGAAPAQAPLGVTPAAPARRSLPPSEAVSPMRGVPGVPGVPGKPGHSGVPGEPGVLAEPGGPGNPGQGVYQNRPLRSAPQAPLPERGGQAVPSGVPHPPQTRVPTEPALRGSDGSGGLGGLGGSRGEPSQTGRESVPRDMQMPRQSPQAPMPAPAARSAPAPSRVQPDPAEPVRRAQQWQSHAQPQFQPQPGPSAPIERVQPNVTRPQPRPQPSLKPQAEPQTERAQVAPRPVRPPERPQAPNPQPQGHPHPPPAPRESKPDGARAPSHETERPSARHDPSREDEHPHG